MSAIAVQRFRINVSYGVASAAGAALLTWAASLVRIPLPFTPVPVTMQTLSVLFTGALLGPKVGGAGQILYLAAGLAGLPVFATAAPGPAVFLSPTGGYLIGFAAAAFVLGKLFAADRPYTYPETAARMLAGQAIIYLCGLSYLWFLTRDSAAHAMGIGFWPFLAGDLVKLAAAASLFRALHAPIRRALIPE